VFQDLYDLRPAGRPGDWRKGNFHDVTSSIADSQLEGTGYHRLGVCPPGIQGSAPGGAGRPIRSHDGHDRLPRTRGVFVIGVPRGSFHRPSARVIPPRGAADRPLAAPHRLLERGWCSTWHSRLITSVTRHAAHNPVGSPSTPGSRFNGVDQSPIGI
jgi:hypothetical protein